MFYPQDNIGEVAEAMAVAARDAGVRILLGDPVVDVDIADGDIRSIRTEQGEEFTPDVVISTAPLCHRRAAGSATAAPTRLLKYNWSLPQLSYMAQSPRYHRVMAEPTAPHHLLRGEVG